MSRYAATSPAPSLPPQSNFGVRNDLQLRGIKPYASGEFQVGVQYIANYSNDPDTHGGWGVTLQHVQQLLGGDNKLALQYGRGGGTGFGTLARFYYPDFSVRHDLKESRAAPRGRGHHSTHCLARRAGGLRVPARRLGLYRSNDWPAHDGWHY